MSIAEGAVIGGKLRLERPLAKGGMGTVWVARHQLLDTDVAVKFMEGAIASDESLRQRFEREAKAAALIKSPHVVQVLDYGIEDGTPYIVMELLEGEDLGARLERTGSIDIEHAYRVLEPLGKALRRAHELGIVHRDLKPGNIFLARSGDDEIVKVLDFGIAKDVSVKGPTTATSSGMMLGSPSYMSPEQIRDTKGVDHLSDLWSIGVILYESLTGVLPFGESENVGKLLVDICTAPLTPPSSLVPSLGPDVDRFFERALAREKSDRFQSMGELVEAFGALAGIRPALRSGPIGESSGQSARISVPNAVARGTDATLAVDAATAKSGEISSPKSSAPDVRSTLSPAESGARGGSPKKRLVPVVVVATLALAAIAGVVALRERPPPVTPSPSADAQTSTPAAATNTASVPSVAPAEALRSARVAIEPKDAEVDVDGRAATVDDDGFVSVSGTLGSIHALRVHKGDRESRADIAITEQGALPAKLVLEAAAETKPAHIVEKPPTPSATQAPTPAKTPPPVVAAPPPTAKPTPSATTTSNGPQPVRTFE